MHNLKEIELFCVCEVHSSVFKQYVALLLLLSEKLSSKYAKLHSVAASNNKDHAL